MKKHLTDKVVKSLPAPEDRNTTFWDESVPGFGIRVNASGSRNFVFNYRIRSGRERRLTIGAFGSWSTVAARAEAKRLQARVDMGEDPLAEIQSERDAQTMADLFQRYAEEHLPRKSKGSIANDKTLINKWLSGMRALKVAEVTHSDIDAIHRRITRAGHPTNANRAVALLSKMFSLAMKWGWRNDNPTMHVERNREQPRNRYLSEDELARLKVALASYEHRQSADAIRLLLLTGARKTEVLAATWDQFDLEQGIWTKPAAFTKQRKTHRVPLSAGAVDLLRELHERNGRSDYLFPLGAGHQLDLRRSWRTISKAAGLAGVRIHDLRHSFASLLASSGLSLPIIGQMLGHTQSQTTQRYSHLLDEPLGAAADAAHARIVGAKPSLRTVAKPRR
jgi:integrase